MSSTVRRDVRLQFEDLEVETYYLIPSCCEMDRRVGILPLRVVQTGRVPGLPYLEPYPAGQLVEMSNTPSYGGFIGDEIERDREPIHLGENSLELVFLTLYDTTLRPTCDRGSYNRGRRLWRDTDSSS